VDNLHIRSHTGDIDTSRTRDIEDICIGDNDRDVDSVCTQDIDDLHINSHHHKNYSLY